MSNVRVVITGLGMVTPLGATVATTWQALCAGTSGIVEQDRYPMPGYSCKVAGFACVDGTQLDQVFTKKEQQRSDRFMHLAMLAGTEALNNAGLSALLPQDRTRIGCYLGVGFGGLATITDSVIQLHEGGPSRVSPFSIPKSINNLGAAWLAMKADLQGPIMAMTNACASGADAIGMGYRQIQAGIVDYMLVGGAESCITPLAIAAFGNMRALYSWQHEAARASRPFDRDREGFVIAEGAGMLVLEREDYARQRGAFIYAELVGYGASADAYHMTAMHPEGRGAQQALRSALQEAGLNAESVDYINAHGTGTAMNDVVETNVIKKIFGEYAYPALSKHLLVSSTKSMMGHTLGAAGGIEAAISALTIQHGIVPPTINLDNPAEGCDLDYVAHQARECLVDVALSQSFGFGGGNVALVLKRYIP